MTKRVNGPDLPNEGPSWLDVGQYMREVEKTHNATLFLTISTDGRNYVGTVFLEIKAYVPILEDPGKCRTRSIIERFPSNKHKTLEGLALYVLYQLDHKLGSEVYKQAPLPF